MAQFGGGVIRLVGNYLVGPSKHLETRHSVRPPFPIDRVLGGGCLHPGECNMSAPNLRRLKKAALICRALSFTHRSRREINMEQKCTFYYKILITINHNFNHKLRTVLNNY